MNCLVALTVSVLGAAPPAGTNETSSAPPVGIAAPYYVEVNVPFQIEIAALRSVSAPITVSMEKNAQVRYSQSRIVLPPGQTKTIVGTILAKGSGLAWLRGIVEGYGAIWTYVIVNFDGSLKANAAGPISYDKPATVALALLDSNGKPLRVNAELEVKLRSADGLLSDGGGEWTGERLLALPNGARISPQFLVRSRSRSGGAVHVSAMLCVAGTPAVLAQEELTFSAEPVWWLPIVLAIAGGLVHAGYKLARAPWSRGKAFAVVVASTAAGVAGFIFANLDLFGLHLDPAVLRTYPLVGFLFSYFGVDVLLKDRFTFGAKDAKERTEKEEEKTTELAA